MSDGVGFPRGLLPVDIAAHSMTYSENAATNTMNRGIFVAKTKPPIDRTLILTAEPPRAFSEIHEDHRATAKMSRWSSNQALEPEGPFLFLASTHVLRRGWLRFGFCASV